MGTLSGRLRQTNERLQRLESMRNRAFQGCLRILHTLTLLWHKDATKVGTKGSTLPKAPAVEQLKEIFPEEADMVEDIIDILVKNKFMEPKKSSQGTVLYSPNKNIISDFAAYLQEFTSKNTALTSLPNEAFALLAVVDNQSKASVYETFTINLDEIVEKMNQSHPEMQGTDWAKVLGYFKDLGEGIDFVKSSPTTTGLRITNGSTTTTNTK